MTMTRAVWWSGGGENLTGVSTRESGRKGMDTVPTDNYVEIPCERRRGMGWQLLEQVGAEKESF